MLKIAITGASGFVGTNLQNYLNGSCEIEPYTVRYTPNQEFEIKADVLIHLAGKAHDLKKVSKPEDYYDSNFELTKQLFNSFLTSNASVFIFMSTVKAVVDKVEGVLTEDYTSNPQTHYGIAKHKAEEYILSQKWPDGKRVYIIRACMIHGPENKGNLNLLYQLVVKGLPWPLGAFENQRSFLSIENLCFVINELLENSSIPSGVYQIADDESLSTNDLIKLLRISLDKKCTIFNIPSSWIRGIALLGDYLHLPINTERLQKLTENYVVSNQKIVNAIGKPLPVNAKVGLLRTFESFKS